MPVDGRSTCLHACSVVSFKRGASNILRAAALCVMYCLTSEHRLRVSRPIGGLPFHACPRVTHPLLLYTKPIQTNPIYPHAGNTSRTKSNIRTPHGAQVFCLLSCSLESPRTASDSTTASLLRTHRSSLLSVSAQTQKNTATTETRWLANKCHAGFAAPSFWRAYARHSHHSQQQAVTDPPPQKKRSERETGSAAHPSNKKMAP